MYNIPLELGLIGPITQNKLRIIYELTSLDIRTIIDEMEDKSIYTLNHYKVYIFSHKSEKIFTRIDSKSLNDLEVDSLIKELNILELDKAFKKINTYEFIESVEKIYINLPLREDIKLNNIYDRIIIYENRGFTKTDIGIREKIIKNKPKIDSYIFNSYDFTKNSSAFVSISKAEHSYMNPFILKDNIVNYNNIIKNAREKVFESINNNLFGYIII